jgi:preprotein translocase subunit SecG
MLAILIKIIHFIVCIGLIVIVLLQADKGEGLAGAFGGGASSTVFGERGAGTFISKLTTGMAVVFMITSLLISVYLPRWETNAPAPKIELSSPVAPVSTTPAPTATPAPAAPAAPLNVPAPAPAPAVPTGN